MGFDLVKGRGFDLHVGWVREVRNATNKERYVCARARVGERPVSVIHATVLPLVERERVFPN
jgi:hypothetical protein